MVPGLLLEDGQQDNRSYVVGRRSAHSSGPPDRPRAARHSCIGDKTMALTMYMLSVLARRPWLWSTGRKLP